MICVKGYLGHIPNCSKKQSPIVKVKYARLKLPRMISLPSEKDVTNGLSTIVDGTAFTVSYQSYINTSTNDILEDYGNSFGYEYPLRAEIFKHARNDRTTKYVNITKPVYYVAVVKKFNTNFKQWSSGILHEYKYFLASYHRCNTCDWRDDLSIQEVIFGPILLSEIRRLEQ